MRKSSPNDKAIMVCLVAPDGNPVRANHDVIISDPQKKGEFYKARTDGSGKILVPKLDDLEKSRILFIEIRQSKSGNLVKTHHLLYEKTSALHREWITLPFPEIQVRKPPPIKPSRVNRITYLWRQTIRKMLQSTMSRPSEKILIPRVVSEAIFDLNNACFLARRILSGDLNAAPAFLKLTEHRQNHASFFASGVGLRTIGMRRYNIRGLPCVFQDGGAIEVAYAGLLLDLHRAETLGDLTQPGANTEQSAHFLLDRHLSLQAFAGAVADFYEGRISEEAYRKRVFGDGSEAVPLPDELEGFPDLPGHGGGSSAPLPFPPSQPGVPEDFGRDIPCDLAWVDCVDEIVEAATSYTPPARCADEEVIGSLSPRAACRGEEDVEIEIRPVAGRHFSGDATKCNVLLQRLAANLNVALQKTRLSILSFTSDLVKVRLEKAERSGCIGFRGSGGGVQANIGFLSSCFKLGRIHSPALERLLVPGSSGIRLIHCTGRNQFSVLSEPILEAVSLNGENHNANIATGTSISLIEEACTDVNIAWRFIFDDPNVDPADFIHVSVRKGNTAIGSDLGATDSISVNEQTPQTYTLKAIANTGQHNCGELEIVVEIDRYDALHLQGGDRVQTGQTETVTVSASCPAPTGGNTVQLSASDETLLEVPATTTIAAGETTATFDVLGKGDVCAAVTLTATAANHLSASHTIEVYRAPQLNSLDPPTMQTCQTIAVTLTGTCFHEDETIVRAIGDGVIETFPIVSLTDTQIVVQAAGLSVGAWQIEVISRGLASNTLSFGVTSSPAIVESFVAFVAQPPSGDPTKIVPCVTNWTNVAWRLRNSSRVEIRENDELIFEEDLDGCGGPFENSFTRVVDEQVVYRLSAFPVGGGTPEIQSITLGTSSIHKLTLNNVSDKDLVIWVYDGQIVFADDIPPDSPKHDLAAGESLELNFSDCDFKDIAGVDKVAAQEAGKDPYGNAVTISNLVVFNMWDIVGGNEGMETSVDIDV